MKLMNILLMSIIVYTKTIALVEMLCNGYFKRPHSETFNTTEVNVKLCESGFVMEFAALGRSFRFSLWESDFFVPTRYNIKRVSNKNTNESAFSLPSFYEGICEGNSECAIKSMFWEGKFVEAVSSLYDNTYKIAIQPIADNIEDIIFNNTADCNIDNASHIVYLYRNYKPSFLDIDFSKQAKSKGPFQLSRHQIATKLNPKSSPQFQPHPSKSAILDPDVQACYLHIVIDHRYFKNIAKEKFETAVWEVVYHVSEADEIFRTTDFNADDLGDNIGFVISNVTVYETDDSDDYKLANDMSVSDTLDKFSEYDFSEYCLGVLFTYQEFQDGIIGLAWAASSSYHDFPGGICQERYEDSNGIKISLNTLLVSQLNYGRMIPRDVVSLTLAHEFGHSFGAFHDESNDKCAPGGRQGNYIMNAVSVEGYKPYNRLFSECSKLVIAPVIHNKGASCFSLLNESSCGNSYIELGEECDCGIATICKTVDPCCTVYSGNESSCTLARHLGSVCTPKMSPCCMADCRITPSSRHKICENENECKHGSYCDGLNATCPEPQDKENGTLCAGGTGVCQAGLCLSLCELHELVNCQCQGYEELCSVCCRLPMHNNSTLANFGCQPMIKLGVLNDSFMEHHDFKRPIGSPCNNSLGYCNGHKRCVLLSDQEIYISSEEVFDARQWVLNYWVLIVLCAMIIAIIVGSIYVFLLQHETCKAQTDTEKLLILVQNSKQTVKILNLVITDLSKEPKHNM